MIEYVAEAGVGHHRRDDVRQRSRGAGSRASLSPRATAASTKPRTDCSSVAERTMRAISGVCTTATPSTSAPLPVPRAGHEHEDEEQRRERR